LLIRGPDMPAYSIPRRNNLLGRWMKAGGWWPDRQVRLINRLDGWYTGRIHERVELPDGRIGRLRSRLLHRSHSSYADVLERIERYSKLEAVDAAEEHRTATRADILAAPAFHFLSRYLVKAGFRDGRTGLIEARLQAYYRYLSLTRIRYGPEATSGGLGRWLLPRNPGSLGENDIAPEEPSRYAPAVPRDVMSLALLALLVLLPFYLPLKEVIPGSVGVGWKETLVGGLSVAAVIRLRGELLTIFRTSWLVRLMLGFGLLVILRALLTSHLATGLDGVQIDLTYMPLALVFLAIPAVERLPVLLFSTLSVGLVCAMGAIAETASGRALVPSQMLMQQYGRPEVYISATHILRPYFVFDFPTGLGAYLAVATVLAIGLYLAGRVVWALPLAGLTVVGLLLTFSRGPWVACLAGLVVIAVLASKAPPTVRIGLVAVMVALLIGSALYTGQGSKLARAITLVSSRRLHTVAGRTGGERSLSSFLSGPKPVARAGLPPPSRHSHAVHWRLGGRRYTVLAEPAPTKGQALLGYRLHVPNGAVLAWGIALDPRVWRVNKGDGVRFSIAIGDAGQRRVVFDRYIDPKQNSRDRRAFLYRLPLSGYAGHTIRIDFITDSGPLHDADYDWSAWLNPGLVRLAAGMSLLRSPYASVNPISVERVSRLPGGYLASVSNWEGDQSNSDRLAAWHRTVSAWMGAAVLGLGPGAVDEAALRAHASAPLITESQVLKVLAETGVVGLLIWLGLSLLSMYFSSLEYRRDDRIEGLITAAVLTTIFVAGIAFQVLEVKQMAALFWSLTGFAVVAELLVAGVVVDPSPIPLPTLTLPELPWDRRMPELVPAAVPLSSPSGQGPPAAAPGPVSAAAYADSSYRPNGHSRLPEPFPLTGMEQVIVTEDPERVNEHLRRGWRLIATGVVASGPQFVLGKEKPES
ncbi:MAG TPA: hypothetical protein VFB34_04090, partial [Chloroflexota bacterium]|nr:hypothetical protein [Chloroflexota bacterium]